MGSGLSHVQCCLQKIQELFLSPKVKGARRSLERLCGWKQQPDSRTSRQIASRCPFRVGGEDLHPARSYRASARRPHGFSPFAIAKNSCGGRAHCLGRIEANTMAPAFEKRKSFVARSTSQETGNWAETCLSAPRFGAKLKELGKIQTWHKLIG